MERTSRARVHATLEPTDRFLESILANVPDAVFVKDRDRRYVLVNDAFLALAGRGTAADVLGRTDEDFLPPEVAARFRATDREVLEHGRPVGVEEERYTDADAREFVLATSKVPIRDESGTVTHLLGIVRDVTRTKNAEEALRVANEELEGRVEDRTQALRGAQQALLRKERLAVLGQLAGGLAHQIRNPLAAIHNGASVLKRRLGESMDSDVQQALTVIREEVWQANRIITDLLDYARIRPASLCSVLVAPILEAACTLALVRPEERVVVELHVDRELQAHIDEHQMRDALGNLIRNAVEAMPDGGAVTLEAFAEGDEVLIAVQDTGPGISLDSLTYLFEPLVTSKPLGLGLGLATAKALVENQGGTIRCTTGSGGGARFEIRVPRAEE